MACRYLDIARLALLSAGVGFCVSGAVAQPVGGDYTDTRTASFSYAPSGLLISETIEPGKPQLCVVTEHRYDAYGNKDRVTTKNCAGASGIAVFEERVSTSIFGASTVTVGSDTAVVAPAGTFATAVSNTVGHTESRLFDPRFGSVMRLTGPNGIDTYSEVDDFGRKTLERRADGTQTVNRYCYLAGRVSDITANSTGANACPGSIPSDEPSNAILYEQRDLLSAANDKIGAFVRIYFDAAGRKVRSVTEAFDGPRQPGPAGQPNGTPRLIAQDTDYSAFGAVVVTTQPYFLDNGSSTPGGGASGLSLTDYDALGRPVRVFTSDPTTTSATGGNQAGGSQASVTFGLRGTRQAARASIDYNGLLTTTTDDKGRTGKEEKNAEGRVVRTTDAYGAQVVHQHDASGNLVATKDTLNNSIIVSYDARGRKVRINDPDAGVTVSCYDALSQLKAQQSSAMRANHVPGECPLFDGAAPIPPNVFAWTTFSHDKLGRMISRVENEYTSTWTFDNCPMGKGKLCASGTSEGLNRRNSYDNLGRPLAARTDFPGGSSAASSVAYDPTTGRVALQTYPTGLRVAPQYTPKGYMQALRLETQLNVTPLPAVVGGPPGTAAVLAAGAKLWEAKTINAWGGVEQVSLASGVDSRATFGAESGRLLQLTAGSGAMASIVDQRLSWDSVSQLTRHVDAIGDSSGLAVTDNYSYDTIGRMVQYEVIGSTGTANAQVESRTVTLHYNALGMLLYKSDVGNYTYPAQQGTANVRPHAVRAINGPYKVVYTHDLNGNVVTASAGAYRSLAYTSFNQPSTNVGLAGPNGTPRYTWQYDENHARIKESRVNAQGSRTTWFLHPDNQGGLGFEREVSSPTVDGINRHYLSAGGAVFGVIATAGNLPSLGTDLQPPAATVLSAVKVEYWHKDHLGSLIATTDHLRAVTQRYSYDPFGKRRFIRGSYDAFGALVIDWTTNTHNGTDRGFTGHEHLDDVGVVHMNGRMLDPVIGRVMQADPIVQSPGNLQNYDRYAYCFNSPGTCTDPSGYKSFRQHFRAWDAFVRHPTIQNAHGVFQSTPHHAATDRYLMSNPYAYAAVKIVVAYFTFGLGAAGMDAYFSYEREGSASAAVKGFAITAATNWAFNAVGGMNLSPVASVFAHAVVGCVSSEAGGGNCMQGALAAGFGKALTHGTRGFVESFDAGFDRIAVGTAIAAMSGGVGAELGGGKFVNGATTAAMGYLFNECMHTRMCGSDSTSAVNATGNVAASPAGYITMLGGSDPSIHLGFEIVDGYGSYRIDGAPSCIFCVGSPDLIGRWGGPEGGRILFRDSLAPRNGMSLGDLANSIRAEALTIQGQQRYSYPNLLTGSMGSTQYNSNSFFSTIFERTLGASPQLGNKGGFIYPGAESIIPRKR